jgi:hypothetical protein
MRSVLFLRKGECPYFTASARSSFIIATKRGSFLMASSVGSLGSVHQFQRRPSSMARRIPARASSLRPRIAAM